MTPGTDYIGVTCVFACHDGNGRVLLAQRGPGARDEHGRWDFGAGKLEHGEDWETAVRREVLEEYGALPKQVAFLTAGNALRQHEGRSTHWIWLLFAVHIDPNQARNNEPHKFDALDWFAIDALPDPLHSQINGRCLSALRQYLKQHQTVAA